MGSPVKMIKNLLLRSFIRTLNRILLIPLEKLNDPTVPLALMLLLFFLDDYSRFGFWGNAIVA